MWSFGSNYAGQLGTGNTKNFNVPQKILEIPPVLSVPCGLHHTLIITNDSDLWSCGNINFGQLCLGNNEGQLKPQQTLFSNIAKTSTGSNHSLFLFLLFFFLLFFLISIVSTKEKYFHVVVMNTENVDWVISITPNLILNVPSNIFYTLFTIHASDSLQPLVQSPHKIQYYILIHYIHWQYHKHMYFLHKFL